MNGAPTMEAMTTESWGAGPDEGALNDDLMLKDGLHPNGKGVAVIVENMLPKVEELLARTKPKVGG